MLDKRDMTPMKWYLLVLGVLLGVSTVLTGCDLLQGLPKELPPSSSIRCDVSQCYGNLGGSLLFRVDSQGQFHRLHRLTSSEGRDTVSLLTDTTGDLYGVNEGGPYYLKEKSRGGFLWGGVLFAYRASDGSYHRLHVFKGSDGDTPVALLEPSKDLLVGCTAQGGVDNKGVLFRLDAPTKRYQILHEFKGKDGEEPVQLLCVGALFTVVVKPEGLSARELCLHAAYLDRATTFCMHSTGKTEHPLSPCCKQHRGVLSA